jgi:hypothetical protein
MDDSQLSYLEAKKIVDDMGNTPCGALAIKESLKKFKDADTPIEIIGGDITLLELKALVVVLEYKLTNKDNT